MAGAGSPGREGTPMLAVVPDVAGALPAGEPSSLIDQIVRDGARQMLAAALQAEVAAYIGQFAGLRDEDGGGWWCVTASSPDDPRTTLPRRPSRKPPKDLDLQVLTITLGCDEGRRASHRIGHRLTLTLRQACNMDVCTITHS